MEARQPDTAPADLPLLVGLLFRTLAPMRNRDRLRATVKVIVAMRHAKASCWLGMTMHRKHARRVLTVLHILLIRLTAAPAIQVVS